MSESKETMTIAEACAAIDYNPAPGFENKTESQQWSMIKAKRIERAKRDAVNVLGEFMTAPAYKKLADEIKDAIATLAVKRTGGGGFGGARKNVFMDNLKSFLVNVGDKVDELEMFKATKMGRGEIRAKIRENLKNAKPEDRFWVELDAETENWTLIGLGADQPEAWQGAPIDVAETEEA